MKKRLIFVVFYALGLLAAAPAGAMTLAEIRTQIRRNLRDTSSDATLQTYSDTVLLSYINEAQREVSNLTWAVQASTSISLVANTTFYDMPDNFLAPEQVTWTRSSSNVTQEIKEITERRLKQTNTDFERMAAGPPTEYFTRHATDGGNPVEMGLVPAPSSTSTGTLKIDYYAQPADLSGDSDTPFDGYLHLTPYHSSIVYHVTARLKVVEGEFDEAKAYNEMFGATVTQMKERFNSKPNYNPSAVGSGPSR